MASGGKSRSSRKPDTRWPFSNMIGMPPPRPRPELACGATAATRSVNDDAPKDAMSASFNSSMGGTSVSTAPLIRSAVTTISPEGPPSTAFSMSSLAMATVLPVFWTLSMAIAGTEADNSKIALKRVVFMGRNSMYIIVTFGSYRIARNMNVKFTIFCRNKAITL